MHISFFKETEDDASFVFPWMLSSKQKAKESALHTAGTWPN
jgi:hypothetical protein